jgi:Icc-related predicted phosphoesterase
MKILAFSDLHGNKKALLSILSASKKADILLCSGDLTNFQVGLNAILARLNALKKPVVIIPGNHESPRFLKETCRKFPHVKDVHKGSCTIGNLLILGYGSGGFLQREPDFPSAAKKFSELIKRHPEKKVIMLTHAPPYNTRLDRIMHDHSGNKDIAGFIRKNRVDIIICGHFHENAGIVEKIGKTIAINPGAKREIEIN